MLVFGLRFMEAYSTVMYFHIDRVRKLCLSKNKFIFMTIGRERALLGRIHS